MTRYDVTITDGTHLEVHRSVSWSQRNRLVDFGFRHGLTVRATDAAPKARGKGTYR